MALEDDSFWEDSEQKGFNFDDDEGGGNQMCGVTLGGTALLLQQVKAGIKQDDSDFVSYAGIHRGPEPDLYKVFSGKALNCILEADCTEISTIKTYTNVDEEVKALRKQVESFWFPSDVKATVRKMMLGLPYTLEFYHSFGCKKELLNAAIALGDGDTILAVVLYLSRSLKKSLLNQLLMNNPVAATHYASYLATRMQTSELTDLLEMLGRSRDASMKHFEIACQNPQRQLQRLRTCVKNHFTSGKDRIILENFIKFLEWQQESGIMGNSVVECLYQACRDHWNEVKGSVTSPLTLSQQQGISDKQFQWTVISARAELQAWHDIESMFVAKSWLGGRKAKASLSMEHIVTELHKHGAPSNVLLMYLQLIDNIEKRLSVARALHCHKAIIDVYVSQRDRQALVSYKATLHPQSEDYFYAENALRTPVKWKN